jgi:hypothetical protein
MSEYISTLLGIGDTAARLVVVFGLAGVVFGAKIISLLLRK